MTLSISNLKAAITKFPLLDPTKYQVTITGPKGTLDRDISLLCNSVILPGRGFSTAEKYHHGPIRKVPYAELYEDAQLTFYETSSMEEKHYFDEWQSLISGANKDGYFIGWYQDIIGTVSIMTINKKGVAMTETTLYEAYPVSIGDTKLSYEETDTISVFSVTFAYHHWTSKPFGGGPAVAPSAPPTTNSQFQDRGLGL
jgi:hypothetical protein